MADDEEDDESFGDFKFASFPNQSLPSTSAWGNFVNHSNHINGTTTSKPSDPFTVSPDPLGKTANKARGGAIPLSIFGEEEDDEPVSDSNSNDFFSNGGGVVKKGSDSNGSVGISDLISNLYHQQNGSALKSNVGSTSPKNSNVNDLNQDEDEEDDGWEFKSAERETGNNNLNAKVETPKHGNSAVGDGALFDSSAAFSDKVGEWNPGFEFSPISASHSLQLGPKGESIENGAGFTMFNQTFGKLANAHSWPGSNQTLEAPKKDNIYPAAIEALNDVGAASHGTVDPSLASQSHQSNGWGFDFNFKSSSMGENSLFSESYFVTEKNHDENNKSSASPANVNVDSDVNLFESKDAVTEIGIKNEKPLIASENRREALPLSIFGDDMPDKNEMPDTNEHSVPQDLSPRAPVSPMQNNFNSPGSNLSINDLIWSLYSQSENKTSPNVTPKASENQIRASPELSASGLDHSDDFDDDFGDFKDASPETTLAQESAQNTSLNHPTEVTENGLQTSLEVLNSDLINDNDGFEDDSWEFKDAISGKSTRDQASTIDHKDLLTQLSPKLEPSDCVEFFSTLKDELCNNVLFHLQNLKKAQDVAALSGEDAKVKALELEIQEFSQILRQHHMSVPVEYLSENYSPRNVNFDELLKILKEPKFLPLESEYQLVSRLSVAETDIKSAMELLKESVSTLRILKLGSGEEHSNYLTIWSKIAFVCSKELQHGAYTWKQAIQKNVHDQLLSIPKGVQYVHALGEIYRVAKIVGASAKLHKPWVLSGSIDCTSLFALLNECNSLWLASGLEEALSSISNCNNFDADGISSDLVESIKYIHELDEHVLQSYVFSEEETMCQLSALPADCIPGLDLVTWNGKHCFVKLANLWVNLISSDPPK
ncbi:uncharacterized protein LOC131633927 [Vicia villosa]|uniref:uncharacterized protein LOC131633927 n=1 Tax=Vicia villosa TaxID=3911 RepID=UPI00273B88D8|nr:uncharacterized protein LOC131633927 [Vicia villosa]